MKELKAAATLDPRNASYWQALAEAQAAADDYEGVREIVVAGGESSGQG